MILTNSENRTKLKNRMVTSRHQTHQKTPLSSSTDDAHRISYRYVLFG